MRPFGCHEELAIILVDAREPVGAADAAIAKRLRGHAAAATPL
jgi:hypothetical protein